MAGRGEKEGKTEVQKFNHNYYHLLLKNHTDEALDHSKFEVWKQIENKFSFSKINVRIHKSWSEVILSR